jgi:hypothetical protein
MDKIQLQMCAKNTFHEYFYVVRHELCYFCNGQQYNFKKIGNFSS